MRLSRTIDMTPTMEDWPPKVDPDSTAAVPVAPAAKIGQILLDNGKLEPEKIHRILKLQQKSGMRFGEAALKLRLLKPQDLLQALSRQFAHPCLQPGEAHMSREIVAAYQSSPTHLEALRQQRSVLAQHWFSRYPALAIISPEAKEGRSYLAANLAVSFAQLGRRTLLIDGDMRAPRQHEIFKIVNRHGFSTFLAGRAGAEVIQSIPALAPLAILPAGPIPPNPNELLERGGLSPLLEEAFQHFQVIIVDTPAGKSQGDAQVIARHCGGALMVVRQHHTRLREAKELVERLSSLEVKLVGTVLNQF